MLEACAWRKQHLGPEHALTHGATYDVSRVRRARAFAAAMAAPTAAAAAAPAVAEAAVAEAAVATGAEAAAEAGDGEAGDGAAGDGAAATEKSGGEAVSGSAAAAASAAAARSSRVAAALEAMQSVAADLDASWVAGLQRLCAEAGEAAHKWAEHMNMLASVAQLHKDWAEAALLFRLANPTLHQVRARVRVSPNPNPNPTPTPNPNPNPGQRGHLLPIEPAGRTTGRPRPRLRAQHRLLLVRLRVRPRFR